MRARWRLWPVFALLLAVAPGCGSNHDNPADGSDPGQTDPGPTVPATAFADSGLQAAVRTAVGGADSLLTMERVAALTQLDAAGRQVTDLSGIGQLTALQVLVLRDNRVADLTPLAGLTALRYLDLENNRVSDLTPLAGLIHLEGVILDYNQVVDPSPLLALPALQTIGLRYNPTSGDELTRLQRTLALRGGRLDLAPEQRLSLPDATNSWIAFYSKRDGAEQGIYLVPAGGGTATEIVSLPGVEVLEIAWSPNGDRLAYAATVAGRTDLFLVDGTTQVLVQLTQLPDAERGPAFSPDGNWLAFSVDRAGAPVVSEIYLMRINGTGRRQLTADQAVATDPSWHPDGEILAYSSDRRGNPDIYTIGIDGTGLTKLTYWTSAEVQPAWSPDGKLIAFASDRGGDFEIYVMNADGGAPRRLTDDPAADTRPSWSPDGRQLAYLSDRGGVPEIRVLSLADGVSSDINLNPYIDGAPAWSPAWIVGFDRPVQVSPFVDPALDTAMRRALGISSLDPVPEDRMLNITTLDLSNQRIRDLTGLERLVNLESLILANQATYSRLVNGEVVPDSASSYGPASTWNQIQDLSPLATLVRLEALSLNLNPITDLSPLAGLTRMTRLDFGWCGVTDLSPLAGMTGLRALSVWGAPIESLSPLAGLSEMRSLGMASCRVRDLSPLRELIHLVRVEVSYNQIEDISPLLHVQETLYLTGNPLSQQSLEVYIPELRARGVTVYL